MVVPGLHSTSSINIKYQLNLIKDINAGICEIEFQPNGKIPDLDSLNTLFGVLEYNIKNKCDKDKGLLVELQILLIGSVIIGLSAERILNMNYGDWFDFHNTNYVDTSLKVLGRNNYSDTLLRRYKLDSNCLDESVFVNVTDHHLFQSLSMLFIMNGIETTVNQNLLRLCFGRYHYLRSGRIKTVRKFLKDFFRCDNHIDLLVKLGLVGSIHYNTMMKN